MIADNVPTSIALRAARWFVANGCSAIPASQLESELFCHANGSFIGGYAKNRGLINRASGGTFFLDEVGDLSPAGQAILLRVLQAGEIRRIESDEPVRVALWIIAAVLVVQVQPGPCNGSSSSPAARGGSWTSGCGSIAQRSCHRAAHPNRFRDSSPGPARMDATDAASGLPCLHNEDLAYASSLRNTSG